MAAESESFPAERRDDTLDSVSETSPESSNTATVMATATGATGTAPLVATEASDTTTHTAAGATGTGPLAVAEAAATKPAATDTSETSEDNATTAKADEFSRRGWNRADVVAGVVLLLAAVILLPFTAMLIVWQISRALWVAAVVGIAWLILLAFGAWVLSRGLQRRTP